MESSIDGQQDLLEVFVILQQRLPSPRDPFPKEQLCRHLDRGRNELMKIEYVIDIRY
jgi:hypothetical protein